MIGLFLGDTDFSKTILNKIKRLNKKYFIIDLSKNNIFCKDKNSFRISIGKFGKIIDLINKNKAKKVLFAGKILKPNFSTLRLDLKGIYYMPRIIKILSKEKIKVIRSNFYSPELSLKSGNYSIIKPDHNDNNSIKKGIKYFKSLNSLDHVQAIIVKDDRIVAKEGKQGTKKMISKLKKNSDGILIKFPKPKQDLRLDLPTVGFNTLKDCKKFGLKGLVLKSRQNIFLDKEKCINFANKNNIFIKVI